MMKTMSGADAQERIRGGRETFERALYEGLRSLKLMPAPDQIDQLWRHYQRVVEANRRFNLTRITGPAQAAIKHYVDCLSLLTLGWVDRDIAWRVLDVGTGAGLPAVPLAVFCPGWRVLAIDGTGKKARFVAETAAELGLSNLDARHVRAAELVRETSQRFDLILLRAVGSVADGIHEVAALLSGGGRVVFYKTPHMPLEEYEGGVMAAREVGLTLEECVDLILPAGEERLSRRLICFRCLDMAHPPVGVGHRKAAMRSAEPVQTRGKRRRTSKR